MKKTCGYILLEGGAEFGGKMADADRKGIELAGGHQVRIDIIPAAAAPDHNHVRAGENGVKWFKNLGATQVVNRLLIDYRTAQDPVMADELEKSQFIYLLGGFPAHLAASLRGSKSWQGMHQAWKNGAVLGGSSAGAMVLADHFYDPGEKQIQPGLGLLTNLCIIPHYRRCAAAWINQIRTHLPDTLLLGLDEETGIINDAGEDGWTVYGKGNAYLHNQEKEVFHPDEKIPATKLPAP